MYGVQTYWCSASHRGRDDAAVGTAAILKIGKHLRRRALGSHIKRLPIFSRAGRYEHRLEKDRSERTGRRALGGAYLHLLRLRDDLLDTLVPFFTTGLESNEFCLWAPSEPLTLRRKPAWR